MIPEDAHYTAEHEWVRGNRRFPQRLPRRNDFGDRCGLVVIEAW